MPRHRRQKVAVLRVSNDKVAGPLGDVETERPVEPPQIIRAPSEWRPLHARQKLRARVHRATLPSERRPDNVPRRIRHAQGARDSRGEEPVGIELIRRLYDYHHWANRRLLDVTASLGEEVA